jgi:hypothetical protein
MDRSGAWIRDVWFGFGKQAFYVRVDTEGAAALGLKTRTLSIVFVHVEGRSVTIRADGSAEGCGARAAAGEIVEVAIPLSELGAGPGEQIQFHVDAVSGPAVQRVPSRLPVTLTIPREGDGLVGWMV